MHIQSKHLLLTLFFVVSIFTGCAGNMVWDKPGASQQEFNQDSYACTQSSQQYQAPVSTPQPQGQMVGGIYVAPSWTQQLAASINNSPGGYVTNQNLYKSCMQAKGWSLRSAGHQTQASTSISDSQLLKERAERQARQDAQRAKCDPIKDNNAFLACMREAR